MAGFEPGSSGVGFYFLDQRFTKMTKTGLQGLQKIKTLN